MSTSPEAEVRTFEIRLEPKIYLATWLSKLGNRSTTRIEALGDRGAQLAAAELEEKSLAKADAACWILESLEGPIQ